MTRALPLSLLSLAAALLTGCATTRPATVRHALSVPDFAPVRSKIVQAAGSTARADQHAAKARDAVQRARATTERLAAAVPPAAAGEVSTLRAELTDAGSEIDTLRTELGETKLTLQETTNELDAKNVELARATADYRAVVEERNKLDAERAYWQQKQEECLAKLNWYRLRFWGPIILAGLAVVIFLLARFTAWGGRTLAPFVLGAERVAIRATTGLSPPG